MYTFKKEERLCSKKLLDQLFSSGSSFLVYPFKVVYLREVLPVNYPSQVVIVVPKRRFRRAHDRNLIKRRIREVYRLHKHDLFYSFLKERNMQILLSLQYVGKEIVNFSMMDKKLQAVFRQLNKIYSEDGHKDN
ncbi:ribonuclease P protein component [Pararcticibacter amylolyticus]|uniref:Ribonuclease P protein component n=1 Tax=Pararcticibacter amylolyticus TaxID=2173175 RepID=A0A2U2PHX5_9SPHI|nr:ribonuclease P protein component [Pararcticibacter amylolyticus]PWG80864.1 ribonuclease P protein component [Pararcticibacter amylolyticus]